MAEVKATPTIVHQAAPVEPMPITPERYISVDYAQRENDNLWPRMWLFACLQSDVANVGDFSVFNLGRESIIISRCFITIDLANFSI